MDKIKVTISPGFIPEKEYIIDVMLNNFLGLSYTLEIGDDPTYTLTLPNGKKLILPDAFFNRAYNENKDYLSEENIPDKVSFLKSEFSSEDNVPIIFGDKNFEVNQGHINCGIDIFASSFFMLTRWEEYCIKEKNQYGNFPNNRSFLQRNKISHRPIVNEYLELLWNMLVKLGFNQKRKQKKYAVKITHDIDSFARYDTSLKFVKALGGDVLLRKKPGLLFKTISDFINIQNGKLKDPYDTFDYLMDVSEENGLKSHFYFIPGKIPEEDVRYNINDTRVGKTIRNIIKRGHIVGLHGTYSGYNNPSQFKNELKRLQKIHPDIKEGRQHYLRFSNPGTWQMWEDMDLEYDSSMGYENEIGFRSGVCYEYPVFNILTRIQLKLVEQPLIFMEAAAIEKHMNKIDFLNHLKNLVNTVKKYNGTFVFLWHNSNINTFEWKELGAIYPEILKSLI